MKVSLAIPSAALCCNVAPPPTDVGRRDVREGAVHHMWAEVLAHVPGAQRVGSDHVGEWEREEKSLTMVVAEAVSACQGLCMLLARSLVCVCEREKCSGP